MKLKWLPLTNDDEGCRSECGRFTISYYSHHNPKWWLIDYSKEVTEEGRLLGCTNKSVAMKTAQRLSSPKAKVSTSGTRLF